MLESSAFVMGKNTGRYWNGNFMTMAKYHRFRIHLVTRDVLAVFSDRPVLGSCIRLESSAALADIYALNEKGRSARAIVQTILHECAHLMFPGQLSERQCNEFADGFLQARADIKREQGRVWGDRFNYATF